MNSRIYNGKVMHARHSPIRHRWVFPFYFYAIDLNELPDLDRSVHGFGYNHWKPVNLRDSDYLRGVGSLRKQLEEFVDEPDVDRIILVSMARFLVKGFNPVSFYYVLKKDGGCACMIAEVNNTFGERHLYRLNGGKSFPLNCRHDKKFHVSPFNSMEGEYEFIFSKPGDDMSIEIKLIREGAIVLNASMWGTGKPLNTGNLWKTVLCHPFTASLTMPRILWKAAVLHYIKKLSVFKKPAPSNPMTIKTKA